MSFFGLFRNKTSKLTAIFLSIALFISFTGCAQIDFLNTINREDIPEREGISVFDSDFEDYNDNVSKSNKDEKADEEARIRAEEEAKAKAEAEAKAKAEEEARKKAEEEAKAKAEAEAKAKAEEEARKKAEAEAKAKAEAEAKAKAEEEARKKAEEEARKKAEEEAKKAAETGSSSGKYVLNTNTKKIHRPSCRYVSQIKKENLAYSNESISALKSKGYEPCKVCSPN